MFIGREKELKELKNLFKQKKSFFVICTGRRRIGKSTLIEEFGKNAPAFYEFQGLHPLEAPKESDQLKHFATRLKLLFKTPQMQFTSWTEAFLTFSQLTQKKSAIVFFDEISWMSSGSTTFSASPYLQKKTTKNKGGCQIDLMIVTQTFKSIFAKRSLE